MSDCKQCDKNDNLLNETQANYGVLVYQLRYICKNCKKPLILKSEDAKGVSFKDWVLKKLLA